MWGMVDILVKVVAIFIWVYVMTVLGSLLALSLRIDYNYVTQLWWCAYCFIIFFGASLLCYIACFVRDYNEEEQEEAAE